MTTVIKAENLGKKYIIRHQNRGNFITLRDTIAEGVRQFGRRITRPSEYVNKNSAEEFWALKDISFEIQQGDRIGVIGRNGAGKSTMLKILSRITEPTTGRIGIKGRIASLLEVGTGFHPELTGRENVFLNGAILGMSRAEIKKKFDEIVDFADVEKFIDTPVKRYSSGMYVRLAFAVAANLETEILIVDEVLAVGDAQFQQKCLGKMYDVGQTGRTVIFVSHNMGAIQSLCNKGIFLNHGMTQGVSDLDKAIDLYLGQSKTNEIVFDNECLKRASIKQIADELEIEGEYDVDHKIDIPCLGFVISDNLGNPLFGCNPVVDPFVNFTSEAKSSGRVRVRIQHPKLLNGTYRLSLWFGNSIENLVVAKDCITFEVLNMVLPKKVQPVSSVGPVFPKCIWNFE